MSQTVAIIVAAGKGNRMGSSTLKQYLVLGDKAILCHTVDVFNECMEIDRIILVLPDEDFSFCRNKILSPIHLGKPIDFVSGGQERQDSVAKGLEAVHTHDSIVVIHDGVRPFIRISEIRECLREARETGACAMGMHAQDTLKKTDPEGYVQETIERKYIWMVQTPQAFKYQIIKNAHKQAARNGYRGTDDAQLVEKAGYPVKMILGSRFNFKITTPEDFELARTMMMHKNANRFQCMEAS
jgi:2-C-methyl-D-erythritol 4-phosphate cytidylyltransferase